VDLLALGADDERALHAGDARARRDQRGAEGLVGVDGLTGDRPVAVVGALDGLAHGEQALLVDVDARVAVEREDHAGGEIDDVGAEAQGLAATAVRRELAGDEGLGLLLVDAGRASLGLGEEGAGGVVVDLQAILEEVHGARLGDQLEIRARSEVVVAEGELAGAHLLGELDGHHHLLERRRLLAAEVEQRAVGRSSSRWRSVAKRSVVCGSGASSVVAGTGSRKV
jgi:hypothetical protein